MISLLVDLMVKKFGQSIFIIWLSGFGLSTLPHLIRAGSKASKPERQNDIFVTNCELVHTAESRWPNKYKTEQPNY